MNSEFLALDWKDALKGVLLAFVSVVLAALYTGLTAVPPAFPTTWEQWAVILGAGATSAIGYLLKNLFTNSKNELAKAEPK